MWLCSGSWCGVLRCDSWFFSSGGFDLAVMRESDEHNNQPYYNQGCRGDETKLFGYHLGSFPGSCRHLTMRPGTLIKMA